MWRKYGRARRASGDCIIRRMRIACWLTGYKHTLRIRNTVWFSTATGYANAPWYCVIRTGVLVSPWPDLEGNKLMFLSEWRKFPSAPCLAGGGGNLTARVSMMLKSRTSLTCFRACFLVGLRTYQHPGTFPVLLNTCYMKCVFYRAETCVWCLHICLLMRLFER